MNLKNYTTKVPAVQTIAFIEAYLASAGVSGVTKQFENGVPSAVFFHIEIPTPGTQHVQRFTIRLPAQIGKVHDYLWQQYCSNRRQPRLKKEDFLVQAANTAWKIQQDWVQIQISLIKLKQAEFLEVFMGYLWDGKRSYFKMVEDAKFKPLMIGNKSDDE